MNPHVSQSLSIQSSESTTVGKEPNRAQDPSSISQDLPSQKMNSQQAAATRQANNALKNGKPLPFAMLFPVIEPLIDKDKAMQLRTIYNRLQKNEISKDTFLKHMRSLVGDHMLKLAVVKLQEQAPRSSQAQVSPTQVASHSQVPAQQQHMKMPAVGGKQFSESLKQQPQNMQAPRSSQAQVAPTQVASHSQVPAQQQHMEMPAVGGKQFSESLKQQPQNMQAPHSSQAQVAPTQVASHSQVPAQQQHMKMPAVVDKQFSESRKQQPQNMQVKLQTKVDELTKEKIDLENRLKVALSEVESLLAQKSSWDKERIVLGDKVKNCIARVMKAESSNSELASKLQTCEAIYKTKLEELQSVHNAELKKLQTELEEVRPDFVESIDEAAPSLQDVTRKLFENYCAELD